MKPFGYYYINLCIYINLQSHLFQIKRHAMGTPIIDHELALQHIDGLLQYCEQNLDNIEERTLSELNASICLVNIIQSNRPEPCPILEQLKTDMLPIIYCSTLALWVDGCTKHPIFRPTAGSRDNRQTQNFHLSRTGKFAYY